jgi:hypothetical protein
VRELARPGHCSEVASKSKSEDRRQSRTTVLAPRNLRTGTSVPLKKHALPAKISIVVIGSEEYLQNTH